jgi:integrase
MGTLLLTLIPLKERYMKEHSIPCKTPKSSLRDESSFKHLCAFFGGLVLAEITPSRISAYKGLRRTEGAKPSTLARELEVMRHALNLAVREWEWLQRSPFEKVRIERVHNSTERWITEEEEQRLLEASLPWLKEIIIFALHTGMRRDEILSLKWTKVDLMRKNVTALRTNNHEKRTIPINRTVCELLKSRSKVQSIKGYVFCSQSAGKIDARNLLRAFYAARKKARLEDVRFHDLRHTFATRLVQRGIDLYSVQKLLGHKTITMTLRYAHHCTESLRKGVEVLDTVCHDSVTVEEKRATADAVTL